MASNTRSAVTVIAPVVLMLLLGVGLTHAEGGASSAINEPFRDPDFESWVERFERPGREVYDRREQILTATGVRAGMAVADVGAGTGLFTLMFAKAVGPTGKVYAVDISPAFIANIERRAREQRLDNVAGIVNSQTDARLPPASVDLVFICDTYHHFEQPAPTMATIHRALRPGGRLIIIDFRRIAGQSSQWVMQHVRAGQDAVITEIEQAGFRFDGSRDLLRENFFLEFSRK